MKIEKVALIGLGAVGAAIASMLNKNLKRENFECIVDEERRARYLKDGIYVNDEKQDFNLVTPQEASPADLVIIATKNLQLDSALRQIEHCVGPNTVILSLLNGIQSEREIAAVYGAEKVIYGYIVGINSIHVGNQISCTKDGKTVFGEKNNEKTERILAISELFDNCQMCYEVPADIELSMWTKFHMNVCFNTLSSLVGAPYGGFSEGILQKLARQISAEVVAVANAEGVALTNRVVEDQLSFFYENDPNGKTSMLQDVEAKRKTENDYFCGTICKLGKEHNIPTPTAQLLHDLVEAKEAVW